MDGCSPLASTTLEPRDIENRGQWSNQAPEAEPGESQAGGNRANCEAADRWQHLAQTRPRRSSISAERDLDRVHHGLRDVARHAGGQGVSPERRALAHVLER